MLALWEGMWPPHQVSKCLMLHPLGKEEKTTIFKPHRQGPLTHPKDEKEGAKQ